MTGPKARLAASRTDSRLGGREFCLLIPHTPHPLSEDQKSRSLRISHDYKSQADPSITASAASSVSQPADFSINDCDSVTPRACAGQLRNHVCRYGRPCVVARLNSTFDAF